jgi:hypothetical protein
VFGGDLAHATAGHCVVVVLSDETQGLCNVGDCLTGSITPFWNEQKANIIVTLVKIMTTFCH